MIITSSSLLCPNENFNKDIFKISGSISAGFILGNTLIGALHKDESHDFRSTMLINAPFFMNTMLSKEAYEFFAQQDRDHQWKPIPFYFALGLIMGAGVHVNLLDKRFK